MNRMVDMGRRATMSSNDNIDETKKLEEAIKAADNILLKKYVSNLSLCKCKKVNDDFEKIGLGGNVLFYRVENIVYDKNENIQDKLITVYSTVSSLDNCGLVMILNADEKGVKIYFGIVNRTLEVRMNENNEERKVGNAESLKNNGNALENSFKGNFPGMTIKPVNYDEGRNTIETAMKNANIIASVSSIPALRNSNEHKNIEFIQGIEKLIESMRGKFYSAIIIADAVSNDEIEEMCAEYENIYSQLSTFKSSDQTISKQEGTNTSESIMKGTTETINEMLTKYNSCE